MLEEAEKRFELRLTGELAKVRAEMAAMRVETAQQNGKLRGEIGQELGKLRAEMATMKFDILKWSFLFWIGQLGAIAGLLSWMLQGVAPR